MSVPQAFKDNLKAKAVANKAKFWVGVTRGMRGWFAVTYWNGDGFEEPWDSDDMSYKTKEEAERRAMEIALEQDMEYIR